MSLIFARAAELWKEMTADYHAAVEAQERSAEDYCRGVMLNKRGRAQNIIPETLFKGSASRAFLYASHELVEYWQVHPRLHKAQFERHWADTKLGY